MQVDRVEASPEKLAQYRALLERKAAREREIAAKAPPRARPWHKAARPEQLPPAGDAWNIWLVCGGRGCVAADTRIYLPETDSHAQVADLAAAGQPVTALTMTPNGPVTTQTAGAPFLKGYAELFEVTCSDGSQITVTDQHRFLTPQGWLRLADVRVGQLLAAGAPAPQPAVSGDLYVSPETAHRSTGTPEDSRDGCLTCHRSGDPQLRSVTEIGRVFSPSRDGVDARRNAVRPPPPLADGSLSGTTLQLVRQCRVASNPVRTGRPSRQSSEMQRLGRHLPAVLDQDAAELFEWMCRNVSPTQELTSLGDTVLESRPAAEPTVLSHVGDITWSRVESILPAGFDAFYDMHVPGWNNYAAEGMWHHNSGKTRMGSEWIAEQAARNAGTSWAIVGPTWRAVQMVCIEGDSGVRSVFLPGELESINMSNLEIRLTNGSRILGYPAERPDRLRGSNLSGAWIDELCTMPKVEELFYEALMPALRIGDNPRTLITTTPRPQRLLKELLGRDDGSVAVVRTKMSDNEANLSKRAVADLRARHEGTRIGRMELDGELVEDIEGALWNRQLLEDTRIKKRDEVPDLARIVVGVDPAVTSGDKSDNTGIVVVGLSQDGHVYVLENCTMKGTPPACMHRAVRAFRSWKADKIVGEVNNGGDYIESVLRTVDRNVPYETVHATRGKHVRAQPIAALWEQGRGHIVGVLPELEDQMCAFTGDPAERKKGSPDDLDACVWACTALNVGSTAMAFLMSVSKTCCNLPYKKSATHCKVCHKQLADAA